MKKLKNIFSALQTHIWLIPIGSHLAVSPLFFLLAAASILGGYGNLFFIAYISAFLHELSHVFCGKKLGVSIVRIEILPFGICGKLSAGFIKNPYKEAVIAAAGPAFSGALAALLYMLNKNPMLSVYSEAIDYGIKINLSLMILNLVPALPLDGGRIAKAIISINLGAVRASNLMLKISRVPIIGMLLVSVWLLLTNDFNLSLILIGAFLLGNLSIEQKNISLISLKEILYYKTRLKRTEFCQVTRMAAHESVPARLFLRKLGCYKYHIIDVIDDDGKITKTVTEGQLLNALISKSIRLSMGEI